MLELAVVLATYSFSFFLVSNALVMITVAILALKEFKEEFKTAEVKLIG